VCVASVPKLDILYNVLGSTSAGKASADKAARLVPVDNIFPSKENAHACRKHHQGGGWLV